MTTLTAVDDVKLLWFKLSADADIFTPATYNENDTTVADDITSADNIG
jgi:hypothetical protein